MSPERRGQRSQDAERTKLKAELNDLLQQTRGGKEVRLRYLRERRKLVGYLALFAAQEAPANSPKLKNDLTTSLTFINIFESSNPSVAEEIKEVIRRLDELDKECGTRSYP